MDSEPHRPPASNPNDQPRTPRVPSPDYSDQPIPPSVIPEIDVHRPCLRCGYDLYKLPADAACPECGTPIAVSLHGDMLREACPAHLDALRRSAFLLAIAPLALLCAYFSYTILYMLFAPLAGHGMIFDSVVETLGGLTWLAAFVLWFVGWWRITRWEPGREHDRQSRFRTPVRVCAATTVLSIAGVVVFSSPVVRLRGGVDTDSLAYSFFVLIWLVSLVAAVATGLLHSRLLADRVADHTLRQRVRPAFIASLLFGGVVLVSVYAPHLIVVGGALTALQIVLNIAVFIIAIALLSMLSRYFFALKRAIEQEQDARPPEPRPAPHRPHET